MISIFRLRDESSSGGGGGGGGGAYARDKNTSVRVCAKNAGGLMREGGVFAGHYGIYSFPYRKVCNFQNAHFLGQ